MAYNNYGGPKQPLRSVTTSSANTTPFSKGEMARTKKKRQKNEEPIEDTPRYLAKVKSEREARLRELHLQKLEALANDET